MSLQIIGGYVMCGSRPLHREGLTRRGGGPLRKATCPERRAQPGPPPANRRPRCSQRALQARGGGAASLHTPLLTRTSRGLSLPEYVHECSTPKQAEFRNPVSPLWRFFTQGARILPGSKTRVPSLLLSKPPPCGGPQIWWTTASEAPQEPAQNHCFWISSRAHRTDDCLRKL